VDPRRAQRVSEALREELAEIIEYEVSDPRIASVAVTDVQVTPDLRTAIVRVLGGESEGALQEALQALEGARHYIRRELAARLRLFRVPELHFEAHTASNAAERVEQLLNRIKKKREKTEGPAGNTP
jgi:ribosome-binding factor A